MKINNNTIIDEALLLKYYSNELNEETKAIVEKWIAESDENKKTAKDCLYIFLAIEDSRQEVGTTAQKALSDLNRKISKQKKKYSIFHWSRNIAAILFIPLLSAFLLTKMIDKPQNELYSEVTYNEVKMSAGMTGKVHLSDGSVVWLNSGSCLKYPTSFGADREVILNGEAYFSVTKDESKKFIVNTKQVSIEVLGTEFNIDAYDESKFATTTLVSGSIKMTLQDEKHKGRTTLMYPGQQSKYDSETHELNIAGVDEYNKITAWKDGKIVFRNTRFEDALWILSKRFNIEFVIKNETLKSSSFTGTFSNQSLERVLEYFKVSSNIKYQIKTEIDNNGNVLRNYVEIF